MALQSHKDNYNTNGLTISSLVALCSDCSKLCLERTERVIENKSRAPRGWEKEYMTVAQERRKEDYNLCEVHCQRVASVCPISSDIDRFYALGYKKVAQLNDLNGLPSIQQMSRCERAAFDFSNVLFSLAHKPSKVVFETVDPKTGVKTEDREDGEPSEVHKKVLAGGSVKDEILRRWSTARRGREDMEELGVLRSIKDSSIFKEELERQKEEEAIKSRGTTPKW
ncbi:putative ribosomal P protein AGP2beta-1 [Trypanosoma theileri]|uniref:Putative ribosomal P protein AGP2beta-1 n=1 Tax=Trypanosoma theileri TaxID=67003 RepID=A0A1X0P2C5_9TRYP|nr:putative ribosomal P protein AGP2beta-1 [Trypanosoma theileri]ORC90679.1 putative ribosomal P protein AGP2beta-1 [Trypanosoma theileri]